ncbi:MAG TPA: hypothetical protein VLE73_06750 [Candidatus Saccharimonadales bacterium]|nr:hypothetical protein [Candidatus Saccharimonadales bacterium]
MANFGLNKRILTPIIVVVIVLAATWAGVGFRLLQNKKQNDTASDTSTAARTVSGLPKAVDDVQQLRASGNATEAEKKINAALNDPATTNTEKYQLYIQQGNLLTDKNDYADAAAVYTKAAALDKTYEITVLLGDTWRQAGDNAKAKDYYQQAIPLIPQSSPVRDDDKAQLEEKIKALGG